MYFLLFVSRDCHIVECFFGGGLRLYFTFFPRRFVVSERVSQVLVSSTSNELLHRFGTWDASDLKDWRLVIQQGFNRFF